MPDVDTAPPRVAGADVGSEFDRTEPRVVASSAPPPAKFLYQGSLDGLRALAVLAIIAYHYDYPWARGAYLSVDLFFILSGFLITTLLVLEWRRADRIELGRFWARRARRLLPALMVILVFVSVMSVFVIEPWNRAGVRADGLASFFYVANWRFIAAKQGYFELFSAASPFRHMWTLAIEEQFYLVWPLVVFATLRIARGSLRALAAVCIVGIALSIAAMGLTYGPGDPLRAYYGTDTRAHTILMGALLAVLLTVWTPSAAAKRRLAVIGVVAFVGMLVAWHVATGESSRYYHGGSVLYAALACVVIACALQPGVLRFALAIPPLAWTGRISYGLYLFHWPLIVLLVPTRVHLHGLPLNGLRLTLTFVAATISFYLVELPIRERRRPTLPWRRTEPFDRGTRRAKRDVVRWLALPALAITLAVVLAVTTGASPPPSYLTGTRPTGANLPWSYGDPLFCGTPRPNETHEAKDEAHAQGPPDLARSAAGLRVLVVGDSVACSFFPGVKAIGDEVGATVDQAAVFGCGIASGEVTTTRKEQITPHSERCPSMVDAAVRPAIDQMRPDVVIWMSIWEKSDLVAGGRTLVAGTPEGDGEMLRRMDSALARLTKYGAKVVVLTVAAPAPNDAQGTNNTSNAVDNASYVRLDSILRRFADRHPDQVTLVDLAHEVCPSGPPCPEEVDGRRARPDGRHFTPAAAAIEAHWLMPRIVASVRG